MVSTGLRVASKNPRCTVSGAAMSSWTFGDVCAVASAGTMKSNQPKSNACHRARFRSPIDLLLCAPDRHIAARPPARRERARRIERQNLPTRTCFTTRCVFLVSRKTIAFAVECKDPEQQALLIRTAALLLGSHRRAAQHVARDPALHPAAV